MNLAFACSLRMGEILGLTWKNVHIEDSDIASDNAYIYIETELTRVSKRAMEALGEKDIYHIFKPLMPNTTSKVGNIKAYVLATLFNAPATMDEYYRAEVNHDYPLHGRRKAP